MDIAKIRKKIKSSAKKKTKDDKGEVPAKKAKKIDASSSDAPSAEKAQPPEPVDVTAEHAGDGSLQEVDSGDVGGSISAEDDEFVEILVFRAGGEDFAFRVSDVEEIARFHGLTEVPNVNPFVLGVCSLRGKVLPIADIGKKLTGVASGEPGRKARILVVRGPRGSIGVLVGVDMQFVTLPQRELKERPAHLEEPASLYIDRVAFMPKGFVSIINTEKIFDFKVTLEAR